MSGDRRGVGTHWEGVAAQFLGARGLDVVSRGYHCRLGEIDIVAMDGDTLVFVEVRYRRNRRYGTASESVGHHKQARILRAARHYLMRFPRCASSPIRFDVVAIDGSEHTCASVEWLKDAFGGA